MTEQLTYQQRFNEMLQISRQNAYTAGLNHIKSELTKKFEQHINEKKLTANYFNIFIDICHFAENNKFDTDKFDNLLKHVSYSSEYGNINFSYDKDQEYFANGTIVVKVIVLP